MGKIQCVPSSRNSHNWDFIERSLSDPNSFLEKKIQMEYLNLKNCLEEERNNLKPDKPIRSSKFNQKLKANITNKKKLERFMKWFKISYSELFTGNSANLKTEKLFISDLDENKRNCKNVNLHNQNNRLQIPTNQYNNINSNKILFDFSDTGSNHSQKSNNNDAIDKYFTSYNGISSIEFIENEILKDNISEYGNSLQPKANINNVPLSNLSERNTLIANSIEKNIRKYYNNNTDRFFERVFKGPPESFRWLSWLICGEIPEHRKNEFFLKNYLEKLDEKIDNQIKKDLNRTIVEISLTKYTANSSIDKFSIEDPNSNSLYRVLRAFSNNDKEVSYCQGMNFIAGFILIASDFNETETFYMLIALFSETFGMKFGIRGFFSENFPLLKAFIFIFNYFFQKKMPEVKEHFKRLEIPDEVWISKWIQTLYTICLPIDATMRVWDCMMSQGLEFLISFSIAFVKHFESDLLKLGDSFEVIEFFRNIFTGKIEDTENINEIENNNKNSKNLKISLNSKNSKDLRKSKIHITSRKETNTQIHSVNFEEIISQAKKLKINKNTINLIKKEYQTKYHVDLSFLYKEYDMSIAMVVSSVHSVSDSNSLSAKASDLIQDQKFSSNSEKLPKLIIPTININTQLLNDKSTGLSQTNIGFIKENSDNINLNVNQLQTQSVDGEEEYNLSEDSVNSVMAGLQNQMECHCFRPKSSLK